MALPVTQVNRLRMERVCGLIEAFESQVTDFAKRPATFQNEDPASNTDTPKGDNTVTSNGAEELIHALLKAIS